MNNANRQSASSTEEASIGFTLCPEVLLANLSDEERVELQKLYALALENAQQQAAWHSFDFDLGALKRLHESDRA